MTTPTPETRIELVFRKLASWAGGLGAFDRVTGSEFKSAPGRGVSLGLWVQRLTPAVSGLSDTSAHLTVYGRIYTDMLQEPSGEIDPRILRATSLMFGRLIGGFTLDGLVRMVDVRGAYGPMLDAQAGYLTVGGTGDGKMYRIMTLTIPLIVNDCWPEEA